MDLPDDLALPLRTGSPWWYWLGGRISLDFVNTRRERWWRDVETLVTPADFSLWTVQARILPAEPAVSSALLEEAHDLREAVDAAAAAVIDRRAPGARAVATIERWLSSAHVPDRFELETDGRPALVPGLPSDPARHALALIALDAATMLGTAQRDRLRICASDTCSARFFDRSRGARRRWCSMQGCGNVAKARRHRARHAVPTTEP